MKTIKRYNFYKGFKWVLLAISTIILAGVVVLCCCGFNLGVEFSGGSKFNIEPINSNLISDSDYKNEFVENQDAIIKRVKKVFNVNGLEISNVQIEGDGNNQSISFIFKNKNGIHKDDVPQFNENLKIQLEREISLVSEKIDFQVNGIDLYSPSIYNNWIVEAAVFCVVILIIFIYFAIRFFPYSAISTVGAILLDVLTVLSIISICRIEITKFIACAVLVCAVLDSVYQIIIFSKIKESYLNNELGEKTNKEIAVKAIKQSNKLILIASSLICLIGISLMFFNLEFGLYLAIPCVVSTVSSLFISPCLFGFIAKNKRFIPTFNKFNR